MSSLKRYTVAAVSSVALGLLLTMTAGAADTPSTAPATRPAVARAAPPAAPTVVPTAKPRVDTPSTLDDLKALQKQVEEVVKKGLPATVAIITSDGQGSGIIISKDGVILTAAHVIEKPGLTVTVVLADGRHLSAKTLGTDHDADTGMLKITKAGDYPYCDVGQSGPLKRGEWVVALGHPGGYNPQSTTPPRPPVARLGRVISPSATGLNQLDTDCTLIMGDSGGPLFDLEGHVVGIHSKISIGTQLNMHVPVDLFLKSWQRLARGDDWNGTQVAVRGAQAPKPAWLGISVEDDDNGCKVTDIGIAGNPGEKAGLKPGDVITKFNARDVGSASELLNLLTTSRPNREVAMDVLRDGEKMTLKITPVQHP